MVQEVRVITAGSRTIIDYATFRSYMITLIDYYGPFTVITGRAPQGGDDMGYHFARWDYKLSYHSVWADWQQQGRKAGMLRNIAMAEYASLADRAALFCLWDGQSQGTRHMIQTAQTYGLDTWVYRMDPYPLEQSLQIIHYQEPINA